MDPTVQCQKPRQQPYAQPHFPYILPSPSSKSDHCDIILWHQDHLLYFLHGKTTVHGQRKCHNLSAHLLVSLPESPVTTATLEPHHLFLNLNFMSVKYIQHMRTKSGSWDQCRLSQVFLYTFNNYELKLTCFCSKTEYFYKILIIQY